MSSMPAACGCPATSLRPSPGSRPLKLGGSACRRSVNDAFTHPLPRHFVRAARSPPRCVRGSETRSVALLVEETPTGPEPGGSGGRTVLAPHPARPADFVCSVRVQVHSGAANGGGHTSAARHGGSCPASCHGFHVFLSDRVASFHLPGSDQLVVFAECAPTENDVDHSVLKAHVGSLSFAPRRAGEVAVGRVVDADWHDHLLGLVAGFGKP